MGDLLKGLCKSTLKGCYQIVLKHEDYHRDNYKSEGNRIAASGPTTAHDVTIGAPGRGGWSGFRVQRWEFLGPKDPNAQTFVVSMFAGLCITGDVELFQIRL